MPDRATSLELRKLAATSPLEWCGELPGALRAAPLRHQFVAYLKLHTIGASDISGAEMIVAELIANVVRHAHGCAVFHLDWHDERPTLLVLDAGPGFPLPAMPRVHDPDAESGRGLSIVCALATAVAWGNRPEGGAYVRATLPVLRLRHG